MNRRQFLLGAAATPVAFALPLPGRRYEVIQEFISIIDGSSLTTFEACQEMFAYGRVIVKVKASQ